MKVYSAYREGRLTIYLQGELDHHEAKKAIPVIEERMDTCLPRYCVLDLGALTFMDSSGIALILKLYRRMGGAGLCVENIAAQPMRVLDTSGIGRMPNITLKKEA